MTTFGLLPGACHGPWCWTATVAALEDAGDDVVLVGHSLGAHAAVRASHAMPVAAVLFVCGVIPPREGEDTSDEPHLEADGAFEGLERDAEGRIFFPDPADAIRDFFPDCGAETAAWAAAQLRPQSTTPHEHINDPVSPPTAPCASIVCTDDRVARAEWGRWAARELAAGRAGGRASRISRAVPVATRRPRRRVGRAPRAAVACGRPHAERGTW